MILSFVSSNGLRRTASSQPARRTHLKMGIDPGEVSTWQPKVETHQTGRAGKFPALRTGDHRETRAIHQVPSVIHVVEIMLIVAATPTTGPGEIHDHRGKGVRLHPAGMTRKER